MTLSTNLHEPLVAFGKTNEKTGVVGPVIAEGVTTFAFNNAASIPDKPTAGTPLLWRKATVSLFIFPAMTMA